MDDRELSQRLTNIENTLNEIRDAIVTEIQEQTEQEEEQTTPKRKITPKGTI